MKNLLKISFIFFLISCTKEIELDKTVERNGLVYEINKNTPYTGIIFSYHENGQIESKEIYKNGLLSGVSEYFFINGQLKQISNFFEGVIQDGDHTQYFKDGKIAKTWTTQDGKLNGVEEIFYENGKLETRKNFLFGEIDGLYEEFNEDGSLDSTKVIKNGHTLDSKFYSYHDNGQISSIDRYWSDQYSGPLNRFETFFENGVKEFSCYYKNEEKDGVCETYYENSFINERANYTNGELNGLYETFYENGSIKSRVNYKDDDYDGLAETFYENGSIQTRTNFKDGELNGLYETFSQEGILESQENYKNDKKIEFNRYVLRLRTFISNKKANEIAKKLKINGYPAFIKETATNETLYVLYAGPFISLEFLSDNTEDIYMLSEATERIIERWED